MKKILILLCILSLSMNFVYSANNDKNNKNDKNVQEEEETIEVPKNVRIISQSCNAVSLFITVIDLSNNEIVILEYDSNQNLLTGDLLNIIRTGMFADPKTASIF